MPFFQKKTKAPSAPATPEEKKSPSTLMDVIAPAAVEISAQYLRLGEKILKSSFVFAYPKFLATNWFSPIINFEFPIDISICIYPMDTSTVLKNLRKKVAEVQAQIMEKEKKGIVRDPMLESAYRNIEELRDRLQEAQERMFRFGVYFTIYGDNNEELERSENALRGVLDGRLVYTKAAIFQQKEGFNSTSPFWLDQLGILTPMNSGTLCSIFPFVSFDLSSNEGILYGINRHNNSLVLFDRFSLENANFVVFGKSGGGKSYATKLEILRSLMMGSDVIIIDPENEYQHLAETVGGTYFRISLTSVNHINPFDLPPIIQGEETAADALRSNIINLVGLLRIMLGGLTPEEDAVIDKAIAETYAARDITPESDFTKINPPTMGDLQTILEGMDGAESLAKRLERFTRGSYSGFLNQPTNVEVKAHLVIFNIRDLEDELRPIAMYIILRYIWNLIRSELKKRILAIDEAWVLMQHEDGASFLYGIAKRARKYYLGLTTITQDVNDFMKSSYGQPIIANSSLQLLLKQSPSTIDTIVNTFNLTQEEKYMLLEAEVGEGLFFAGLKHVAIKVVASYSEDQIITTDPEQLLKIQKSKESLLKENL